MNSFTHLIRRRCATAQSRLQGAEFSSYTAAVDSVQSDHIRAQLHAQLEPLDGENDGIFTLSLSRYFSGHFSV